MDDTAYCLSYLELGFILAAAAMNLLVFLALCIMTRRNCVKDGCLTWETCAPSHEVQTHRNNPYMYHPWQFIKETHIDRLMKVRKEGYKRVNEVPHGQEVIINPVQDITHHCAKECIHRRRNVYYDYTNQASQLCLIDSHIFAKDSYMRHNTFLNEWMDSWYMIHEWDIFTISANS